MHRLAPAAALGSAALLLSGCSLFSQRHDVSFEVSGAPGAVGTVTYEVPGETAVTAKNAHLPWTTTVTSEFGFHTVAAKPTSDGALTCRIVADGKEIAKVTGAAGQPVKCSRIVNDR